RVLIGPVAQRILQIVVHAEARVDHGLACILEGGPGQANPWLRKKLRVIGREDAAAYVWLARNDAAGVGVIAGAVVGFVPAGAPFIPNAQREREVGRELDGILCINGAEPGAPAQRGGRRVIKKGSDG